MIASAFVKPVPAVSVRAVIHEGSAAATVAQSTLTALQCGPLDAVLAFQRDGSLQPIRALLQRAGIGAAGDSTTSVAAAVELSAEEVGSCARALSVAIASCAPLPRSPFFELTGEPQSDFVLCRVPSVHIRDAITVFAHQLPQEHGAATLHGALLAAQAHAALLNAFVCVGAQVALIPGAGPQLQITRTMPPAPVLRVTLATKFLFTAPGTFSSGRADLSPAKAVRGSAGFGSPAPASNTAGATPDALRATAPSSTEALVDAESRPGPRSAAGRAEPAAAAAAHVVVGSVTSAPAAEAAVVSLAPPPAFLPMDFWGMGERPVESSNAPMDVGGAAPPAERMAAGSQPLHSSEAVAGLDKPLSLLLESVLLPYTHPALLESVGLQPARGVLLHGPPGTGKTQLVRAAAAIAARSLPGLVVKVFAVDGSSIMSGVPGETEARLRAIFAAAGAHAAGRRPGGSGSPDAGEDGPKEEDLLPAADSGSAEGAGSPEELVTVHDFSPAAVAIAQLERDLRSLLSSAAGRRSAPIPAADSLPASGAAAGAGAPAPPRPALDAAPSGGLSIVFLDEMDALCPRRFTQGARVGAAGSSNPVTARLVAQLLTLMDGVQHKVEAAAAAGGRAAAFGRVVVVGATNRPDAIDPALRRPGRFDREVRIDIPNADARLQILRLQLRGAPLHPAAAAFLPQLAAECVGYVGADLQALCRDATRLAADRAAARRERLLQQLRGRHGSGGMQEAPVPVAGLEPVADVADAAAPADALSGPLLAAGTGLAPADAAGSVDCITAEDFIAARLGIVPSALRGISTRVEHTRWSDVGGMDRVVDRLRSAVEAPLRHPHLYARMRIAPPRGVLLHGPPGNSKTTLVRALASAVHAAFFAVSGAEVYSPYLGEAERTLRALFARARETAPAIIFLDEVDALVGSRGIGGSGGGSGKCRWVCVVSCCPAALRGCCSVRWVGPVPLALPSSSTQPCSIPAPRHPALQRSRRASSRRCSRRWTECRPWMASSSSQPPTGRTRWTPRCCGECYTAAARSTLRAPCIQHRFQQLSALSPCPIIRALCFPLQAGPLGAPH